MKIELIDYTGAGSPDPARHAANLLVFTKQTRLQMAPEGLKAIESWSQEQIEEQLNYMANTIPSSWEFVDYTFMINGVTRAFTHQLVRTRTGTYAQQTMRVLDVSGWDFSTGPTIANSPDMDAFYKDSMSIIDLWYKSLINQGAAIEDARGILPTNIHTNIAAKFNLRNLSEMFRKRASSRTQGEYREVIEGMKAEVLRVHPWTDIFFSRTQAKAASELEAEILSLGLEKDHQTTLVKLVDQLRNS